MHSKCRKLVNVMFFHESWDIMIERNSISHDFPTNTLSMLTSTTFQQLNRIYTFQADPFIIEKDNNVYVFYEAFNFRNSKGTLHCRILDSNLTELEDVKLEGFEHLKCHLSFPYLFHNNDQLFMIPESSERKEVILFQSIDFPTRWQQVKVLLSDIALTDNVLFTLNGSVYLQSTTMDDELVIHTANDLTGPWQKITPVLNMSNQHQRGAGAPHYVDNRMYFLTQECTPEIYGKSIYIKELISLNDSCFEEFLVAQVNSSINQSDGVHTLNFTDNYIVYDSKIIKFSLLSIFKKISYKCMAKYRGFCLTRRHE